MDDNTPPVDVKKFRISNPDSVRSEVKARISNDEGLSLVAHDTTYGEDLGDFIKSVPGNLWQFLRRPIDIDPGPAMRAFIKLAVDNSDQLTDVAKKVILDQPALTDKGGALDQLKASISILRAICVPCLKAQ